VLPFFVGVLLLCFWGLVIDMGALGSGWISVEKVSSSDYVDSCKPRSHRSVMLDKP